MPRGRPLRYSCFLCGKSCANLCQHCKLVAYCSRDHYLAHHQRQYCFPFKLIWHGALDTRSVIATRDIRPLELILFEWNLAVGPQWLTNPSSNAVCLDCCKPVQTGYQCSNCRLPVCNESCQKGANHQPECQLWRIKPDLVQVLWAENKELLSLAVIPTRLIQARKINPKVQARTQYLFQRDPISDESSKEWLDQKAALQSFFRNFADVEQVSEGDLQSTLELVRRSSIGTTEDGECAVFPIFAQFAHSCSSNCKFVVYPNKTLAVLSKTVIKAGEELQISLVPTLEPTWKRRAKLFRHHLIACACRRCRDPKELGSHLSALKCPRCATGKHEGETQNDVGCLLPVNPLEHESQWLCWFHPNNPLSGDQARRLAIDLQKKLYAGGHGTTIDKLEEIIGIQSTILHPHHALLMTVKRSLLSCYSQVPASTVGRKELEQMRDLGKEQLTVLGKIDPGYPDWRGDVLRNYSTAELNLAKLDMEEKRIEKPEFMLRVKKAMIFVQEGHRCTSCVRIDRSAQTQMSMDYLGEEMSADSSYLSDASCSSTCFD